MNRRTFPKRIGAVLAVAVMAAAPLSSCVTPPEARSEAQVEQEIFRLVNEERQSAGLALLDRDPVLNALARQYAASGFSDAVRCSTDIRYLRCNSWRTAYGNRNPILREQAAREQVDYCLATPNLSQTMLRSDARATGVGVAIVGDAVYCVQAFDVLNAMSGDGGPLILNENPEARDPTWGQLRWFVLDDDTDEQPYVEGSFVCADFAAMLHDRAEAEGIRAAYVSVDLTSGPGHTLNAFDTTDVGLVYIDCTGQGLSFGASGGIAGADTSPDYDKVAYLSVGQEYGLVGLDQASAFDYSFYEEWRIQWAEYDSGADEYGLKKDAYDEAVDGRTVITDPDEYAVLRGMYDELQILRQELETSEAALGGWRWESPGTVTDLYVHW